jgi:predicted nucleotidyltransferase
VFSVDRRREVRARLLERAREDDRIAGAALTGSAARDAEDRWSDVDFLFAVAADAVLDEVVSDWGSFVYDELGALHHFDLHPGAAVYRAFLLGDALEIDLGFTPAAEFGPVGAGGFGLVFGDPMTRRAGVDDPGHLIGLTWHHVLHARTSLERGLRWQAEYWIRSIRDNTLALACLRLGLPAAHSKGVDRLPSEITGPALDAFARSMEADELARAFRAATGVFLVELRQTDVRIAEKLEQVLLERAGL